MCGGVCNDREMQLVGAYDIPLLNPAVLTREYMDGPIKSARTLGFYNIGTHRLNGFYFWKMRARMHMQWVYSTGLVDPYNPFDSVYETDLTVAYPSLDGPVPTISMETLRAAMDDYRYCHSLSQLIDKAKASGKAEAVAQSAKAQDALNAVVGMIRPDYLWYTKEGSFPSPDVYDKLRWKVAQQIMKLNGILDN